MRGGDRTLLRTTFVLVGVPLAGTGDLMATKADTATAMAYTVILDTTKIDAAIVPEEKEEVLDITILILAARLHFRTQRAFR